MKADLRKATCASFSAGIPGNRLGSANALATAASIAVLGGAPAVAQAGTSHEWIAVDYPQAMHPGP